MLNVEHKYHTGFLLHFNSQEDNTVSYSFIWNNVVIQYQTELHVQAWDFSLGNLVQNPLGLGLQSGSLTVHYAAYLNNTRVAENTERHQIVFATPESIPDSRFWIRFDDTNLTITPDFDGHIIFPGLLSSEPDQSPGRVRVANTTYSSFEIRLSSTATLDNAKLSYGFSRPANPPTWTISTFLADAVSGLANLASVAVNKTLDLIFGFLPEGDKILFVKSFLVEVTDAVFEVGFRDPILLLHAAFVCCTAYGLLLFIDPMFRYIIEAILLPIKAMWKILVAIWKLFAWLLQFIKLAIV